MKNRTLRTAFACAALASGAAVALSLAAQQQGASHRRRCRARRSRYSPTRSIAMRAMGSTRKAANAASCRSTTRKKASSPSCRARRCRTCRRSPTRPPQQLADIYAYIRTIPADAPALGDVPLLRDILDRKTRAAGEGPSMIPRILAAVTLAATALTAAAQSAAPSAEKQRMIDLGIEHGTARALYEHLKTEANGGQPLELARRARLDRHLDARSEPVLLGSRPGVADGAADREADARARAAAAREARQRRERASSSTRSATASRPACRAGSSSPS